jgi:hypothetical protein
MKSLLACTGLLIAAATLCPDTRTQAPAQEPAATETATIAGKAITITYSSPGVKGRAGKLFTKDGQIGHDPTYPVWRAGANAATKLHTDGDLTIGGLAVPAGDYTLYVDISDPDNWVLSSTPRPASGAPSTTRPGPGPREDDHDQAPGLVENLKYTLATGGGKGTLTLAWENQSPASPTRPSSSVGSVEVRPIRVRLFFGRAAIFDPAIAALPIQ